MDQVLGAALRLDDRDAFIEKLKQPLLPPSVLAAAGEDDDEDVPSDAPRLAPSAH